MAKTDWREGVERWPRALPNFDVEPESTALLLIDLQYFCAHRDYGLGKVMAADFPDMFTYYYDRVERTVIPNVQRLLSLFRSKGLRVIYTTMGPELEDGSDFFTPRRENDRRYQLQTGRKTNFVKGSVEHGILPEVAPQPGELVINKTSVSAFNSTGIDFTLRKMRIDSLVIAGVATNACVETTARDAADRWYKCILVEDACASFDQESHEGTMRNFARLFGLVRRTDEVVEAFQRS